MISKKDLNNIYNLKRPIVLVPMAADLLHHGHIRILKKAKKLGTVIIGLITDKGLETYKGKPLLKYEHRKEIISEIKTVDYVIPLKGLVYPKIAEIIKVNFFVHGTDWRKGPQSETRKIMIKNIKMWGGRVVEIPYTKNISSSSIKNSIRNKTKR